MHNPSAEEMGMMQDWTRDLAAFVHGSEDFQYGTTKWDEYKELTPDGNIEITEDHRWSELLGLMDVISSSENIPRQTRL